MKNKWKEILMNPWTITVGGGLILSIFLSVINDLVKKEQVFNTISRILSTIFNVCIMLLNRKIKIWWLLLGIVVFIILSILFVRCLNHTQTTPNKPEFLEYTQDTILGYKWKWNWQKDIYGKYYVENLCPICLQCDTPLVDNTYGYRGKYKCLRCGEEYFKTLPDFKHVKMMIGDNVRRKYFTNE
ncbi:MAG TPA: hypothetical protein H9754_01495 [Candidatus Anaerostipes avistercoris]|uniref:Uncharacterized protein n=1 Tax=Candidatus Anaerostipes avistercoris TaxID=2838462 RepID=A0A9D2PGW1_9FIRM|nr:hypothetical protein [Candidatus Anaerostipes avistercoris]